jgi:hypothetical protein
VPPCSPPLSLPGVTRYFRAMCCPEATVGEGGKEMRRETKTVEGDGGVTKSGRERGKARGR